jgi:ketosteroid isomerase-like protein
VNRGITKIPVQKGLQGEVADEHFWDAVDEKTVFEFLYNFPGFANKIVGLKKYMDWVAGYSMKLHSADRLIVYKSTEPGVFILEYEVHGTTPSNRAYDNRFCGVITVKNRKIVHWRDYMDSLAVVTATN